MTFSWMIFFLFCVTSPISRGVVQGWIKAGILKQSVCDGGRLWCRWWKGQKQKTGSHNNHDYHYCLCGNGADDGAALTFQMGHTHSRWLLTESSDALSSRLYTSHLKNILRHDCIPVISKTYFITTVYQSSWKDISSCIVIHDYIPVISKR